VRHVAHRHDGAPDFIDVATATLDHPDEFPPTRHVWLEDGIAWDQVGDGLPWFERGTPPEWNPRCLDRLSLAVIQHFFLPSKLHLYAGYFVMKCRRAASIHELPRASIPGNRTFSINHYQKLPVLLVARKDHTIVVGRELHNTL
jgi:hypothetical protein